jgi:hypothetical protein
LLKADILDADEVYNLARRALTERVRTVLRRHDQHNLPCAGPRAPAEDEDDAPWIQRNLWEVSVYQFNIDSRSGDIFANYQVVKGMSDECFDRHGVRISYPKVTW